MEIKEIMNLISDKRLIEVGDKYTVDKVRPPKLYNPFRKRVLRQK